VLKRRHQHRQSPLLWRIREYTAVAIAVAGLLLAADHAYSRLRNSQFARDTADELAAQSRRPATQMAHFQIDVSGNVFATDPHDAAVRSAVLTAAANRAGNTFLTLMRSDDDFIQAATMKGGWDLEFRTAGLDRPGSSPVVFACQQPVTRDVVIRAFQLYRANNNAWTGLCAWTRDIF
jgi:hypothetical protein